MNQMNVRKILGIAILALTPIICFVFPFACGFLGLPQGFDLLVLPIMLFGPIVATFLFTWISRIRSVAMNAAICLVLYATIVVGFSAGPPGAAAWTIGFAYNVRLTKHPKEIQNGRWKLSPNTRTVT